MKAILELGETDTITLENGCDIVSISQLKKCENVIVDKKCENGYYTVMIDDNIVECKIRKSRGIYGTTYICECD